MQSVESIAASVEFHSHNNGRVCEAPHVMYDFTPHLSPRCSHQSAMRPPHFDVWAIIFIGELRYCRYFITFALNQ